MRLIGVTGGIGTGKSTVTNYLKTRYKLPIWDADVYARLAVTVGSPILQQISQRYGMAILQSDGSLDRRRLGEIVFASVDERHWLEAQIHPFVRQWFSQEIARFKQHLESSSTAVLSQERIINAPTKPSPIDNTAILSIPLLFEAGLTDSVTEIWVVSCDLAVQRQRVADRDRLSEAEVETRINSQMPLAEKIAQADVNLDNSTTIADLERQIDRAIATKSL